MKNRKRLVRHLCLSGAFLVAMMAGNEIAQRQPLAALEDDDNCDHGECEHTHRRFWWDSHKCVPNDNRVACGTDQTGEHGCETTHCPPEED